MHHAHTMHLGNQYQALMLLAFAILLIFVGIPLLAYKQYIKQRAKIEVASSPREPMFECPKHGVFRRAQLIRHLDQDICPFCFNDQIKMKMDETIGDTFKSAGNA